MDIEKVKKIVEGNRDNICRLLEKHFDHKNNTLKFMEFASAVSFLVVCKLEPKPDASSIVCPFCDEGGFDKKGLKYHLDNFCKEYKETLISEKDLQELKAEAEK